MTDPKKLAVALQYDFKDAPRVTAKGQGQIAEIIIAEAAKNNIQVEENPIMAQALSQIPLDEEIPEGLYQGVAEILNFILQTSQNLNKSKS